MKNFDIDIDFENQISENFDIDIERKFDIVPCLLTTCKSMISTEVTQQWFGHRHENVLKDQPSATTYTYVNFKSGSLYYNYKLR